MIYCSLIINNRVNLFYFQYFIRNSFWNEESRYLGNFSFKNERQIYTRIYTINVETIVQDTSQVFLTLLSFLKQHTNILTRF